LLSIDVVFGFFAGPFTAVASSVGPPTVARKSISGPHDEDCKLRFASRPRVLIDDCQQSAKLSHLWPAKAEAEGNQGFRVAYVATLFGTLNKKMFNRFSRHHGKVVKYAIKSAIP
jgi:hypothetical protein